MLRISLSRCRSLWTVDSNVSSCTLHLSLVFIAFKTPQSLPEFVIGEAKGTEQPGTRLVTYQRQVSPDSPVFLYNLFAPFFFLLTPVLPSNAGPCRYAHCSPHSQGRSRCQRVFETGPHTLNIANRPTA
eukprot:s111_g54.t1